MTPPTNPMCPHIAECHEHQRSIADSLKEALAPITASIKGIEEELGKKDQRLTRLEAFAVAVMAAVTLSVSIGSCAVSNGYLVVPTKAAKVTK